MTDATGTRSGRPIEPTSVRLSGERADGGKTPPPPPPPTPPGTPGKFPWPRRRTPPPPAGPPAVPPPPPGGMAAAVPPGGQGGPVTYVTNHYYPDRAAGPVPARFSLSRLPRPAWNGSALIAGLTLAPVTAAVLHLFGDEPGVIMAALVAAGLLELRGRGRSWLARVLTCNIVASSFVSAAGLYMYGYLVTGAWR